MLQAEENRIKTSNTRRYPDGTDLNSPWLKDKAKTIMTSNSFVYPKDLTAESGFNRYFEVSQLITILGKKATIHQVTIMLANFKNALFPGHNHLLTIHANDPTLWLSPKRQQGW